MSQPKDSQRGIDRGDLCDCDPFIDLEGDGQPRTHCVVPARRGPHKPTRSPEGARKDNDMTRMTRFEREDLLKIARMHAKVAKADAVSRSAKLRAEFEAQLAAEYDYDDDETWRKAHAAAFAAAEQAQDIVARRCEELGIPRRFAPSLHLHWYRRGENGVKSRRAELTRVAHSKIHQLEKEAKLAIDRASVETQTKLLASALESAEAQAFLAAMPTAAQLMLLVSLQEVRKEIELAREADKRDEDVADDGW
jgi:hypothetical protein